MSKFDVVVCDRLGVFAVGIDQQENIFRPAAGKCRWCIEDAKKQCKELHQNGTDETASGGLQTVELNARSYGAVARRRTVARARTAEPENLRTAKNSATSAHA